MILKDNLQKDTDYIFGIHPVLEAINAGKEIDKILIKKGEREETVGEILKESRRRNIPVNFVPLEKINRVTKKNHQGVLAYLSAIPFASLDYVIDQVYGDGLMPFLLVLDGVTDVRNFGAIARTAEAAGVHAIIVPSKGNAQIGVDAMKTSAGALNHIPVCRADDLVKIVEKLKEYGVRIVATSDKSEIPLYQTDLLGPLAMVVGSEGEGVSKELLKLADDTINIPMYGKINSLNVSVASGVMLYEVIRQRGL